MNTLAINPRYTFARDELKEFIDTYVEVTDEQAYVMADYAISTWLPLPDNVPYLHFVGEKSSGKTQALKVMSAICKRPLFFTGNSTPAALIRLLDNARTLIMDDASPLDFQEHDEFYGRIRSIVRVGSMRQTSTIISMNEANPQGYSVFGYKIFASHKVFQDPSLASRCLTIKMKKAPESFLPVLSELTDELGKEARKSVGFLRNVDEETESDIGWIL